MAEQVTVKVSKRFQIAVPREARERLRIHGGDRLLVEVQEGMIVLLPEPSSYTDTLCGLHKEIWEGVETDQYISRERDAWDNFSKP